MELEIDSLFGLPAHPLVVHAAVVLVPLAALLTVLTVVVPRWRSRLATVAAIASVVALAVVWLATGSGEPLEERVRETDLVEEHAELGEQMLPVAAIAAAGSIALAVVERRRRSGATLAAALVVVVAVFAVAGAVVETVEVARVGHSGARATWEDVDGER